ncbi:MAG: hypothetical protein IRY91_01240 [Gemmatimonadaceae bacterium]|nr:hypothetical protein [Gemmatimonadaceae bacterium]
MRSSHSLNGAEKAGAYPGRKGPVIPSASRSSSAALCTVRSDAQSLCNERCGSTTCVRSLRNAAPKALSLYNACRKQWFARCSDTPGQSTSFNSRREIGRPPSSTM